MNTNVLKLNVAVLPVINGHKCIVVIRGRRCLAIHSSSSVGGSRFTLEQINERMAGSPQIIAQLRVSISPSHAFAGGKKSEYWERTHTDTGCMHTPHRETPKSKPDPTRNQTFLL